MVDNKPQIGSVALQLSCSNPTQLNIAPENCDISSRSPKQDDFLSLSNICKVTPYALSDLLHMYVIYKPFS